MPRWTDQQKVCTAAPEWAKVQAILPPLTAKQVLDLGCGYGWFFHYALDAGAAKTVGLDVSTIMLAKAREMTEGAGIEYRQEDLSTLQLPAHSLDLAYSSLTIHYLKDIRPLFAALYQALVPGGKLVFTAEHPIYTAPLEQA